jgi:hypothetical protein
MATWRMYFPFFTCEVKCGAAALDIADRQNAHSNQARRPRFRKHKPCPIVWIFR